MSRARGQTIPVRDVRDVRRDGGHRLGDACVRGPGCGRHRTAAGTPATVSADALPTWQINGVVWSQAVVGNTVYVTGSFTKARPPGVAAGGAGEVDALEHLRLRHHHR